MATYAVGDLQGCLSELKTLLDKIAFSSSDQLWLTGDLVNRGPDSLDTLRFVQQLGPQACVGQGNHDLHLLADACGQKNAGRKDTFDSILSAPDRDTLIHWLRQQPLLHHDPQLDYVMVHAGIPPIWDLATAIERAREVEAVIQGDQAEQFFRQMYGNEPSRWDDSLQSWQRYRLITNSFTRIRFCQADGTLELETKTGSANSPAGFAPWYSFSKRKTADQRVLFGHWASLEGQADADNVYPLDTGCVWAGSLTALRLDDQRYFSVASNGYA